MFKFTCVYLNLCEGEKDGERSQGGGDDDVAENEGGREVQGVGITGGCS